MVSRRPRSFEPALIVHGGAGARAAFNERPARRRAMLAAVAAGAAVLRNDGSALDAVITTVAYLEDDPLFNAGFGSVLTSDGKIEMDAAVVMGSAAPGSSAPDYAVVRAGGVVLVSRVRNPIRLARAVMELTPHLLLGGAGAERLARVARIPTCRPEALISERARARWLERRRQAGPAPAIAPGEHGTVGAAALDSSGNLAAATSTGGVAGKLPGRIGDSAILGAGLYADARGAASATGIGEAIMRVALCREAIERLKSTSPDLAARVSVERLGNLTQGEAGLIIVDRRGRFGFAHNAQAMEIATFQASSGVQHRTLGRTA